MAIWNQRQLISRYSADHHAYYSKRPSFPGNPLYHKVHCRRQSPILEVIIRADGVLTTFFYLHHIIAFVYLVVTILIIAIKKVIIVKPIEREEKVLRWLKAINREWSVEELAEKLRVSQQTVRRDLVTLEGAGSIIRTLGGCLISDSEKLDTIYYKVSEHNFTQKRIIGQEAAKLIKPGQVMLIGDGSTNYHLANQLGDCGHVIVYTNSIPVSAVLSRDPNIDLYLLGGRFDINNEMTFLRGNLTEQILKTLMFDYVFISTDAITEDGTCLLKNEDIARTNSIILERGQQKILLADHSKTEAVGNFAFAKLDDFDLWITTPGIDEEAMSRFRKQTSINEVELPTNT